MKHRDVAPVTDAQLEERADALVRISRRSVISLERSGLDAAARVAAALLPSEPPPDVVCGSYRGSHAYGGSVPEGERYFVRVVLPFAVVEAEEYDHDSTAATYFYVWTDDEALRAHIHALVEG